VPAASRWPGAYKKRRLSHTGMLHLVCNRHGQTNAMAAHEMVLESVNGDTSR
jgi:hypothetical protein